MEAPSAFIWYKETDSPLNSDTPPASYPSHKAEQLPVGDSYRSTITSCVAHIPKTIIYI